jgi:hypothetical protein
LWGYGERRLWAVVVGSFRVILGGGGTARWVVYEVMERNWRYVGSVDISKRCYGCILEVRVLGTCRYGIRYHSSF